MRTEAERPRLSLSTTLLKWHRDTDRYTTALDAPAPATRPSYAGPLVGALATADRRRQERSARCKRGR
ncbi:hypothetical protein AB0M46_35580 [Dactylosporangium sp. NPDC051485]|uniref:hypothetical protein n=1 Tax=Dactylosporangium sp. NPDC051485 TaxID=3154846 RepID=UPI0034429460